MTKLLENLRAIKEDTPLDVEEDTRWDDVSDFLNTVILDTLDTIYKETFGQSFRNDIADRILEDSSEEQLQAIHDKWVHNTLPEDEPTDVAAMEDDDLNHPDYDEHEMEQRNKD